MLDRSIFGQGPKRIFSSLIHTLDDLPPESEAEKPRYVRPEGCRDLFGLDSPPGGRRPERGTIGKTIAGPSFTFNEIIHPKLGTPKRTSKQQRTLTLPAKVSLSQPVLVSTLADKLGLQFFHIIEKLIRRKIFLGKDGWINFATAAAICAELGVVAEKEDCGGLSM